jgi:hypothetical protein
MLYPDIILPFVVTTFADGDTCTEFVGMAGGMLNHIQTLTHNSDIAFVEKSNG